MPYANLYIIEAAGAAGFCCQDVSMHQFTMITVGVGVRQLPVFTARGSSLCT